MVEKECDREVEVILSLVVQGIMRKKKGVRGRERWTVRNSRFNMIILPVGFWGSYVD